MVKFKKGEMMNRIGMDNEVVLVTTNSFITKDKKIVMGRGAAQQLKESYGGGIDKLFGTYLKEHHLQRYGVFIFMGEALGVFQVKYHFREKADLELIKYSTAMLTQHTMDFPHITFNLNFPGIGYGNLTREEVLPIIQFLPDNVVIWEYGGKDEKT